MCQKRKTPLHLLITLALLTPSAFAQSPAEQTLLHLANQARASHNLAPLHWDANLAQAARAHAQRLIREPGELEHQYPGEPDLTARAAQTGAHFSTIAENLARRAQDPAQLQQVWMSSPIHRANLLDPNLTTIGIAVITDDAGLLYAVEDFARDTPAQPNQDIEKRIAQLLQQHGVAPAASNDDAQKTCEMPNGSAGTPKLVIQYDGPDPTHLPDVLLQQLATGKYTSAQIGICPGQQPANQQFTTYHVAILLY